MAKASERSTPDGATVEEMLTALREVEAAGFEAALRATLAATSQTDEGRQANVTGFSDAVERVANSFDAVQMAGAHGEAASMRNVAEKVITRLIDRLEVVNTAFNGGKKISTEDLQSLADFASDDLRKTITSCVSQLGDAAAREKENTQNSSKEARAVIDSAVDEIDQISLNVRLISLNASVEAARAGEAGRGFGVIASEIQNLATRSQGAVESVRRQLASIG